MKAYKLFRVRKNGSLGSLFINAKNVLPINTWLTAESHPRKGFTVRPFWHCSPKPFTPHLSIKGRQWYEVEIKEFTEFNRPKNQGGLWYLAKKMKIIGAFV